MKISLRRRHALTIADGAFSHKTMLQFLGDFKSRRASKSHFWFKSYGNFAEWVDFAHWWSFIGKGLLLQPAQQAVFPAYKGWTQDQLSIRRHPYNDLKWTKLGLGPIQTRLEAIVGFLVKTKIKAHTKLTVVMCCQIVTRKSVAPSSGDFRQRPAPRYACGQDQESWRNIFLVKH